VGWKSFASVVIRSVPILVWVKNSARPKPGSAI
jgi:hypothetical protein